MEKIFCRSKEIANKYYLWVSHAIELYGIEKYYYERAVMNVMRKEYKKAIADLQKSLELFPHNTRTLVQLAEVYCFCQEKDKCQEILQQLRLHELAISDQDACIKIVHIFLSYSELVQAKKFAINFMLHNPAEKFARYFCLMAISSYEKDYIKTMKIFDYLNRSHREDLLVYGKFLQEYQEFQTILSDPGVQKFLKEQ